MARAEELNDDSHFDFAGWNGRAFALLSIHRFRTTIFMTVPKVYSRTNLVTTPPESHCSTVVRS